MTWAKAPCRSHTPARLQDVHGKEVYCLMNQLQASAPGNFPYADEASLREALDKFLESKTYRDLQRFHRYGELTGFLPDGSNGIAAFWQAFNSTAPPGLPSGVDSIRPFYRRWEQIAAGCRTPCFHILPDEDLGFSIEASWPVYGTLLELVSVSIQSAGASIACAFAVLVITNRDVRLSLVVVGVIALVVLCTISSVFAAGYPLGVNESILIILCVGLSIDYAVHLSHYYKHAQGDRYQRVEAAVTGVGIGVIGGAVTTIGAGLPLVGARRAGGCPAPSAFTPGAPRSTQGASCSLYSCLASSSSSRPRGLYSSAGPCSSPSSSSSAQSRLQPRMPLKCTMRPGRRELHRPRSRRLLRRPTWSDMASLMNWGCRQVHAGRVARPSPHAQ